MKEWSCDEPVDNIHVHSPGGPDVHSSTSIGIAGRGPRAVVKSNCLKNQRSRVRTPLWPSVSKKKKSFFPRSLVNIHIVGSLRDREVACSASDRQGSNFESCVLRAVSSHSSHHPQEVLLAQFSLYVLKVA